MRSAKLGNHLKPFFLKCIFEFMINTAPPGSDSVNGREEYFNCINFKKKNSAVVPWPCSTRHHFLHWSKLGCRATSSCCSFFLSSYFSSLACFCLFSLHDPFLLRDIFAIMYCFLVIIFMMSIRII